MYGGYNNQGGYQQGPPPQNYDYNNNQGGYNNNNYGPPPQQNYDYNNQGGYQQGPPPQNYDYNNNQGGYNNNYGPPQGGYNNNYGNQTTYNPNNPVIQQEAQNLHQEIPNRDPNYTNSPSSYTNSPSQNSYQQQQANKPPHNAGQGRKKALLIGCSYIGQATHLGGPPNDVKNIYNFLADEFDFPRDNMLILSDEPATQQFSYTSGAMRGNGDITELNPTKAHILKAISWFVNDARPNDVLFFMYSGHGGQVPDKNGDEADGMDEVIFPLDYQSGNHIIDDDLHEAMIKRLPDGCRLLCLMDCCHSGSGLDLPFVKSAYESKKRRQKEKMRARAKGIGKEGLAVCWSSCQDSETSADVGVNGVYSGALTNFWLQAMKKYGGTKSGGGNNRGSYEDILLNIWDGMKDKVSSIVSIPQLSYNDEKFDIRQPFYM